MTRQKDQKHILNFVWPNIELMCLILGEIAMYWINISSKFILSRFFIDLKIKWMI